jgi:hypothetical protein
VSTLARTLVAILVGVLILFPGVELLRFVATNLLGLYREMTLTDCLLVFVIILLCALLLQPRGETDRRVRPRRDEPDLTLVGHRTPTAPRRPSRSTSPRRPPRDPSGP